MDSFGRYILSVAILLMAGSPAGATVVLKVDLQELVEASELIVESTVAEVAVDRMIPGGTVHTRVRLRVEDIWKGVPGLQEVNVRLPGGTSGKTQVHVAGIPQFKVGERVVVFLEETRGGYIPSGLSQGVFRVEPFVLGTEKLVRRASDGAGYAQKSAGAGLQWVEPPAEIVHYPLVKLREEVRLYQRRPTTRVRRVEEVLPTVLP